MPQRVHLPAQAGVPVGVFLGIESVFHIGHCTLHVIERRYSGVAIRPGSALRLKQIATLPLLVTCFITAVVDIPIDNISGHLHHPVLCVFEQNTGVRDELCA